MKTRIELLIVIALVIFLGISCKKFLDKKQNTALSTPSTLADLRGILDNADQMNLFATPVLGEASADNYFVPSVTPLDLFSGKAPAEQSIYKWQMIDYYYQNDWGLSYSAIYNSNLVLESLNNIAIDAANEAEWRKIKGTALFFRGYSYLNLAWTYTKAYDQADSQTDLGLDLRTASNFNIPSKRSSVKETYDRIIADLKEASTYLPQTTEHVFRPSKAAAYGALARTYLSMREYGDAKVYAASCLAIKNKLFTYDTTISTIGTATLSFGKVWDKDEVIFHTSMAATTGFSLLHNASSKIDTLLFSSYSTNDMRRTLYFQVFPTTGNPGNYQRFKGTYSNGANSLFTGIAVDEIYLIRAECFARSGNKDAALNDLNTLLIKRWKKGTFTPIVAADATQALNYVLTERRKELIHRGIRWMDIKRLNKEGRNVVLTRNVAGNIFSLQPNVNYYALPLPTDIIQTTNMPQNPR